jgi:hypothetical protein
VLYHRPERRPLQDVLTCIREHVTVDAAGRRLAANAERHLKAPAEMIRLFRNCSQAIEETIRFLLGITFSLDELRYEYPDEPVPPGEDRGIRLNLLEGLVESLPLSLVLVWFSVTGAIMFPVVVCLHHAIWNQIHLEMHKPESRFFSNWAAYRCVARHHYLHHRYPDKNFNVAFPIGDFLFGTIAKPSEADWEAMRAEGIA